MSGGVFRGAGDKGSRERDFLAGDVLVSTHTEKHSASWPLQCVEQLSSSRYLESERVRFI